MLISIHYFIIHWNSHASNIGCVCMGILMDERTNERALSCSDSTTLACVRDFKLSILGARREIETEWIVCRFLVFFWHLHATLTFKYLISSCFLITYAWVLYGGNRFWNGVWMNFKYSVSKFFWFFQEISTQYSVQFEDQQIIFRQSISFLLHAWRANGWKSPSHIGALCYKKNTNHK